VATLRDGQQLRGRLLAFDEAGITLELEGGALLHVPAASLERIERASAARTEVDPARLSLDPGRTRYLYSPSAFMLRGGEGYVSQTELLLTSFAWGVSDHLTVGLGSALPFLFASGGANFVGAVKVGGSVGEHLHLAAGAQALWLPGLDASVGGGFLFGTATVGTPDAHLSLSAGPPFGPGGAGDLFFTLSGAVRVSERVALVSENWLFPGADGTVLSGAVRLTGSRLGVDAGLVFLEGASVPLPWLDFIWSFGTG
jgi:hypothetical protein